jgi:hypothetical protein
MKISIILGFPTILATSLIIFGSNYDSLRAQPTDVREAQDKQIDKLQEVPSETNRNPQLERAIIRYMYPDKSPSYHYSHYYSYNYVDLNSDGKPEIIVTFRSWFFCGKPGCTTLIFKSVGKEYKVLGEIFGDRPIIITENKTNRYKDLVVSMRGNEFSKADDTNYYCYKFNKNNYPNAKNAVRLTTKSIIRGKIYLRGKNKELKLTT